MDERIAAVEEAIDGLAVVDLGTLGRWKPGLNGLVGLLTGLAVTFSPSSSFSTLTIGVLAVSDLSSLVGSDFSSPSSSEGNTTS